MTRKQGDGDGHISTKKLKILHISSSESNLLKNNRHHPKFNIRNQAAEKWQRRLAFLKKYTLVSKNILC
jgi:hypothetical protein